MHLELAFLPPPGARIATDNSCVAWNDSGHLSVWEPAKSGSLSRREGRFKYSSVNAFLPDANLYVDSNYHEITTTVSDSSDLISNRADVFGARVVAPNELLLFGHWFVTLLRADRTEGWAVYLDQIEGIYEEFPLDNFFVSDVIEADRVVFVALTNNFSGDDRLLRLDASNGRYLGSIEIPFSHQLGNRVNPSLYLPVVGLGGGVVCVDGQLSAKAFPPPSNLAIAIARTNTVDVLLVPPHSPELGAGGDSPVFPPVAGVALSDDSVLLVTSSAILILRSDGTVEDYAQGFFPAPKFVSSGPNGLWLACTDAVYHVEGASEIAGSAPM